MSKYPPPFFKLTQKWLENGCENGTYHSHGGNALRLGQFFVNNYLHGIEGKDISILYNTLDNKIAMDIIKKYYIAYQWDMT
jgi:hypothetical protein